MKLVGLVVTRNSDWIIGFSLRAALLWCDAVVVLMHRCNLDSEAAIHAAILDTDEDKGEFPPLESGGRMINRRVLVIEDFSEEWEEMRMRQAMLVKAREFGATHIALIDDDEVLTADLLPRIRRMVERMSEGNILMLPWLQLRQTETQKAVMCSGMWAQLSASTAFKDFSVYHWASRDGYDFHQRQPLGGDLQAYHPIDGIGSGLMHFQFVSRRRLIAKQYLYQLTEMKRWPGRKSPSDVATYYSRSVEESDSARLAPLPEAWLLGYEHLIEQYLNIDAEPWQEAECKRLLLENPALGNGLNDFGLRKVWGL